MENNGLIGSHTSLLVDDVEEAAAHLSATLPLAFNPPARIPFEVSADGAEPHVQEVRACYSTDGSIELVQAADSGPFARSAGVGLHHFGGLIDGLEDAVAAQREAGNEVEWELSHDGQLIAVFFGGCGGVPGRLELVTAAPPPLLEIYAENR